MAVTDDRRLAELGGVVRGQGQMLTEQLRLSHALLTARALLTQDGDECLSPVLACGPCPRSPGPGGCGRGVTFLGSLASFLAACTGLFTSGVDVRDRGCRVPRLAPPDPGGASESCGVLKGPCPRQFGSGSPGARPWERPHGHSEGRAE